MIELLTQGSKVTMQFVNCSVDLPDANGLFFIPAGCGAGKTTIIKYIAGKNFSMGVLIVVSTIEAAEDLRAKLTPLARVCILHSRKEAEVEMTNYRNSPKRLEDYDILVITSARLIIDPYPLFLSYKGGFRKYVLIDEMINFYPPEFSYPKELANVVTYVDKTPEHDGVKGKDIGDGYYQHLYQNEKLMQKAYCVSGFNLFSNKTALAQYKLSYIFRYIIKNGVDKPIRNRIQEFSGSAITLLFDGTINCLADKKDPRLLPVNGYGYGSDIEFITFDLPIRRRNYNGMSIESLGKQISSFIQLVKSVCKNGKVLVVTWMTLYTNMNNNYVADDFEKDERPENNFPGMLTKCFEDNGIDPNNFTVIYRGSGQDRGSNEYRDYSTIIFFGEWYIHDDIVGEVNSMFRLHCTYQQYMKSLLVQTICRIRIRQHKGLPIKVYFSSDIKRDVMYEVQEFFKENSKHTCNIRGIAPPVMPKSKPEKKMLLDMLVLYSADANIKTAIENGTPYQFSITLNQLYSVLPKSKKAKDRYNNLTKYLTNRGITMNIT